MKVKPKKPLTSEERKKKQMDHFKKVAASSPAKQDTEGRLARLEARDLLNNPPKK